MNNEDIDALVQCLHVLKQLDKLGQIDKKVFQGYNYIVARAEKALRNNPEVVPNWYSNNYWTGALNQKEEE